ncbi:hypothetical protein [Thalassotalea ganghwensis]
MVNTFLPRWLLLSIAFTAFPAVFAQEHAEQQEGSKVKSQQSADETDLWGDDWDTEIKPSPWRFSHHLEVGFGKFSHDNIVQSTTSLSEVTLRLGADYQHDHFDISAKGDLRYDDVLEKSLWDTRELNIAFSPITSLDVKLGRQVLTWGTGDYLFLNDLFPKDWQAFFSGRDDEYLKAPSDSIRTTWYGYGLSIDLAYTPEFTSDQYITGERFSFFSPLAQQQVAPANDFAVIKTKDAQWATRIATNKDGIEYALYGYKGFWTTPVGMTPTGQAYFPKLNSWGASIRMPLAGGLFNAEYSRYNSVDDSNGSNPLIANDQQRLLLGYETEIIKNLTASGQLYLEKTGNYSNFIARHPFAEQAVDETRQLLTVRLTYMAMQQKLIYSWFSFYSPSDKDGYIKPSVSYRYSDKLQFAAGANVFFGDKGYSFFGQHQDNSNVWLRAKWLM